MRTFFVRRGRGQSRRVGLALACVLALAIPLAAFAGNNGSWPSGGQNISNTHGNADEVKLNPNNVKLLDVKWTAHLHGDVSAIPAVVDGAVYVPDWGGYLTKMDADTGAILWSKKIDSYEPAGVPPGAVSRASPAVVGNTVYLGDQNGGHLFAIRLQPPRHPRLDVRSEQHLLRVLDQREVSVGGAGSARPSVLHTKYSFEDESACYDGPKAG